MITTRKTSQKSRWRLYGCLAIAVALLWGCSGTKQVLMPPKFVLKEFKRIGVIEFTANAEQELGPMATQNFMQALQSAQPGTRFLELGKVAPAPIDFKTIKALGREYQVDALIVGDLVISSVKPEVKLSVKSMSAKAYIEGVLKTKIYETASGATLWTKSSTRQERVAKISLNSLGKIPNFGISDPKEKYGNLVTGLVHHNTHDFRSYYVTRKQ